MYPIKNWQNLKRGYNFGEKTFYSDFHLGLDIICPISTAVYAWRDLQIIKATYGEEGGNQAWIKEVGDIKLIRLMHLKVLPMTGIYKKGGVIAYTGSTGALCKSPHLHMDISTDGVLNLSDVSNFEDPEVYFANINNMLELKIDSLKNQYLVDVNTKIGLAIANESMLQKITAKHDFGIPEQFDPTGYLIFRGADSDEWSNFLNVKIQ